MLPLSHVDVPLTCINKAAVEYRIPAKLIISVLYTESGKIGALHKNKNGTYDIGPMQINSSHLPTLKTHGITEYQMRYNPCINAEIGAAYLAKAISDSNNLLTGIGDYNSHTIKYNHAYAEKVRIAYTKLNYVLKS